MAKQLKKILIAEDDPFLSKVLGTILVDEGFTVEKALNGEEALQKIKKDGFRLVLLDLIMPKMTGFEVLEELKKVKIKVPILVFSNLSQPEDKKEALSLGAKGFYVKSDMSIDGVIKEVKKYC
jgi:DNA-binding response OmpR family regulator